MSDIENNPQELKKLFRKYLRNELTMREREILDTWYDAFEQDQHLELQSGDASSRERIRKRRLHLQMVRL